MLRYLLAEEGSAERAAAEEILQGRVRGLKDVVEVRFESERSDEGGGAVERWVCPVTRKELGPAARAVYIVPCGHVFSHEAVREVKSSDCVQCGTPYVHDRDVVPILPSTEMDKALVVERLDRLRALGLSHSLKKVKSEKKRKVKEIVDPVTDTGMRKRTKDNDEAEHDPRARVQNETSTTGASTTHDQSKRSHPSYENDNIASLYVKKDDQGRKKNDSDYMTRGYAIPAGTRSR